jgi:hypothetical protein
MLTNEAAAAEAVAVPPVPVAPGLGEVAALLAEPEELQAASRAARAVNTTARASTALFARHPRLVNSTKPIEIRLSRHPRYSQ